MHRTIRRLLKGGPLAAIGSSALALLGMGECDGPSTPTPQPPTCYAPVLTTPAPTATPAATSAPPPPSCYEIPPDAFRAQASSPVTSQVERLSERLAALDKVARMGDLAPDVLNTTIDGILRDVHAIQRAAGTSDLSADERAKVDKLVLEAEARAEEIRGRDGE